MLRGLRMRKNRMATVLTTRFSFLALPGLVILAAATNLPRRSIAASSSSYHILGRSRGGVSALMGATRSLVKLRGRVANSAGSTTSKRNVVRVSIAPPVPVTKTDDEEEEAFGGIAEERKKELYFPKFRNLIGDTPLIDLSALAEPKVPGVKVLAKCEFMNPGYSIKDRIVWHIINEAEAQGKLEPGMTIVAASSGNTGASTAMVASMRGYKSIIITSPKCSKEKMDAIRAYGAKLIVTASGLKPDDPEHYMNLETKLCSENDDCFGINQYENDLNPLAHYETLGPEIWEQTDGTVTHFVAAGSTGGTLSGTAKFLKEKSGGNVKVVMADPVGSIFYDYFKTGILNEPESFEVEGVGKENIPGAMDFGVIDDAIRVSDSDAFKMCHTLAKVEGVMAGGSGGLNVFAAIQIANQATDPDTTIVTVLPDSGIKLYTI